MRRTLFGGFVSACTCSVVSRSTLDSLDSCFLHDIRLDRFPLVLILLKYGMRILHCMLDVQTFLWYSANLMLACEDFGLRIEEYTYKDKC